METLANVIFKESVMCNTSQVLLVILIAVIIIFCNLFENKKKKIKKLQGDLDRWNKKYQWKIGSTTMLGDSVINYRLLSIDNGGNWYVVADRDIIKGNVNDIYPDLLKHLDAWDNLEFHIKLNGSIGSHGAITAPEIKLLENCGFTIQKKTDKSE